MVENKLYYGDNLDILRRYVKDETVDLVYLDPPFNSNANYNVLFAEKDGSKAASQIRAFTDTWTWNQESESTFAEIVTTGGQVSDCLQAFRVLLGENDMLAYVAMMAPRLIELRRVMKQTASIYLHCDPTASHYLKLLMDSVFGPKNFINEIIWKRSLPHGNQSKKYGASPDTILFYKKAIDPTWNGSFIPHREEYLEQFYRFKEPDGRVYRLISCINPNPNRPNLTYEWNGVTKVWKYTKERMQQMHDDGLIVYSKSGTPAYKGYLDRMKGTPTQDIWDDIFPLMGSSAERLGYPTQKPVALLERIVSASSNPGDVVLDPFCGCGTAIAAAQVLGRLWIGIDITHLAITLIKTRLKDSFGDSLTFTVTGEPVSVQDAERLAESNPYQFQWWALGLVGARPVEQKKGADHGIDGRIIFRGDKPGDFESVILSVKAGHTGPAHVRDLKGVLDREKAVIGVLISMQEPTSPMKTEAVTAGFYSSRWGNRYPKVQLLTVTELLAGKKIEMPPIQHVGATFKKAPRVAKPGEQLKMI